MCDKFKRTLAQGIVSAVQMGFASGLNRFGSFSSNRWYMQLARWWSLNNAENSSDFAFLVISGGPSRSLDVFKVRWLAEPMAASG